MERLYEIEIQRSNVSPRQFFTYCKKEMFKRTGYSLDGWCDDYETWTGENGTPDFYVESNHEDWDEPKKEICSTKPYEWQLFLANAYNFILEFQFDTDKKGYGYLYAVEFRR